MHLFDVKMYHFRIPEVATEHLSIANELNQMKRMKYRQEMWSNLVWMSLKIHEKKRMVVL